MKQPEFYFTGKNEKIISRKTYFLLVGHIQTTLNLSGTTSKFRSVTQYVILNM
jgi:hypothetical protein